MKGKDSLLKKQFQKKDVERLRNLVKGKEGNKTTQGVGYTKQKEFYNDMMMNYENWTPEMIRKAPGFLRDLK